MDFSCEDNNNSFEEWEEEEDTDTAPSMSLYAMEGSLGFIPRYLTFKDAQVVTVGRRDGVGDATTTAFFKAVTVSKDHAELSFRWDGASGNFYIRDLGSKNGTALNNFGVRSLPMTIKDGDVLRFGKEGVVNGVIKKCIIAKVSLHYPHPLPTTQQICLHLKGKEEQMRRKRNRRACHV